MASNGSAEDLHCPVCRDIFTDPVLLSCSHSFCEECLQQSWRTTNTRECPFCRRRCSKELYPPNLALKNLCESFLKERDERCSSGSEVEICSLHNEKLKLFCLEDNQPVCVVCRDSLKHTNHTFRPISEIGPSYKSKNELIKKSTLKDIVRRRLQKTDSTNQSKTYRKINFGERDRNKPHKTVLMVGETGTGKTTLINVMINYMLRVKREDKVWFEITDDQSDRTSAHSQTSIITVYGFYPQESPIHLTIIDTPGYGNIQSTEVDKEITAGLLSLCGSAEGIHEIHAVCLVIKATQTRLSETQIYIFDAVQSLFGRDIAKNIVLLFTHSNGAPPKNALTAVKEAEIKCAVNDKSKPVYFLFDNCQSEPADEDEDKEDHEQRLEQSWNLSHSGMMGFFSFFEKKQPKSLKMTQDVLQKRKQLEKNISNLQSRVQLMELKQNELKQTQEALEKNKEHVKNKNFEYEVEVPYKVKVDINPAVAKAATCCSVCEENCHYPGCWWISALSWCEVMKKDHCIVCTNKCHYSKHVKEAKIYETKTKTEKRTNEALKKEYDDNMMKIRDGESLVQKLEEELQKLEKEKVKLLNETFHCVDSLESIALNTDSLFTLLHIDYLIEKLMEINEPGKAETLENIKKRSGEEKQGALRYIKKIL